MIERKLIQSYKIPIPNGIQQISICLNKNCFQKELTYSKKQKIPQSRPKDIAYFEDDFFGNLDQEEKERWNIQ